MQTTARGDEADRRSTRVARLSAVATFSILCLLCCGCAAFLEFMADLQQQSGGESLRSLEGGAPVSVTFANRTQAAVDLVWVDTEGHERVINAMPAGDEQHVDSFVNHVYRFRSAGVLVGVHVVTDEPGQRYEVVSPSSDAASAEPRAISRVQEQTLREGVHFYKLAADDSWEEVTDPAEIRDMTNSPTIPTKGPSGSNEDWYWMHLDRDDVKRYRFAVQEQGFMPKIGYAYSLPSPIGNNWDIARDGRARLLDFATRSEDMQPGATGKQWIVVSSVFQGDTGPYTFEYTVYSGDRNTGTYDEASVVAMLKIPSLNFSQPTRLFVNFDGVNSSGGDVPAAMRDADGTAVRGFQRFEPLDASHLLESLPAAGTTEGLLQHLIYKTAEKFAPFHMQVSRQREAAVSATHSTVFVGNDPDEPGRYGYAHSPRPDDFGNKKADVGWVDWIDTATGQQASVTEIIRSIAHEAGHTLGLKHVRTSGSDVDGDVSFADWEAAGHEPVVPLAAVDTVGTQPEIMSYDSAQWAFTQEAFAITGFNAAEFAPESQYQVFQGSTIIQQNSYTYLRAVVGGASKDDVADVADRDSILQRWDRECVYLDTLIPDRDGYSAANEEERVLVQAARDAARAVQGAKGPNGLRWTDPIREAVAARPDLVNELLPATDARYGLDLTGTRTRKLINDLGDYDVFLHEVDTARPRDVRIDCRPTAGSSLIPVLLLYDETGKELLATGVPENGSTTATLVHTMAAGVIYKVVVGGYDGLSKGEYRVTVTS